MLEKQNLMQDQSSYFGIVINAGSHLNDIVAGQSIDDWKRLKMKVAKAGCEP